MTEEKEKKEESKVYELVNVPTQHVPAIKTPEEELLSTEQAITVLLNKVDNIEKAVC